MTVISVMLLLEKPLRKLMSKLKIRPLVRSYHNMQQQAEVALQGQRRLQQPLQALQQQPLMIKQQQQRQQQRNKGLVKIDEC